MGTCVLAEYLIRGGILRAQYLEACAPGLALMPARSCMLPRTVGPRGTADSLFVFFEFRWFNSPLPCTYLTRAPMRPRRMSWGALGGGLQHCRGDRLLSTA